MPPKKSAQKASEIEKAAKAAPEIEDDKAAKAPKVEKVAKAPDMEDDKYAGRREGCGGGILPFLLILMNVETIPYNLNPNPITLTLPSFSEVTEITSLKRNKEC